MNRSWKSYRQHYRHMVINAFGHLCGVIIGRPLNLLNGKKVLIISPHPDDEAMGCGGLMSSLLAAGNSVSLIIMTRGEHCHPAEVIPCDEQQEVRHELTLRANGLIGLHPQNIHHLGFTDNRIRSQDPEKERLRELIETLAPEVIFTTYEAETSPDHYHTHAIVCEVTQGTPIKIYSYLVWFWNRPKFREILRTPWGCARYFTLDKDTRAQKARMISIYTSARNSAGIAYSGNFPVDMISTLLWKREIFFLTPRD